MCVCAVCFADSYPEWLSFEMNVGWEDEDGGKVKGRCVCCHGDVVVFL